MEQKKTIFFYKSAFCPRCMMAGRALKALREGFPFLEIKEIDVVTHPLRAWQDGIRLIPALRSGDQIISGLMLSRKQIRNFLKEV